MHIAGYQNGGKKTSLQNDFRSLDIGVCADRPGCDT